MSLIAGARQGVTGDQPVSLIAGTIFASLRSDYSIALAPLGPSLSPPRATPAPGPRPLGLWVWGYVSGF